jgi:chemosensory pili system protein ChpA (sensor histidine kinase/response regulator)
MKSILIADDDPAFRETLAKKCAKLGPRIWTAADGAQVMQSLKQSRPNLMIIDVDMPSGDGLKVVERMQQDPSIERMPVIFCTGHGDTEILERCRALNAPCIVKGGETWSQLQPLICRILGLISDIPGARKGVPERSVHEPKRLPKLLFVDDDKDMRRIVQARLRACELAVSCASNATEALRMAVNDPPDVLLTDYWMPEGSGEYLISRIRAVPQLREIPIMVLTGGLPRDYGLERRLFTSYKIAGVFLKPVNFDELVDSLARFIPVNADVWKQASKMRRREPASYSSSTR